MDVKSLAAQLTGAEYPLRIPGSVRVAAKCAGLVVVYGASDDLMEFEGAIVDEIGASDGTVANIDAAGLIPSFEAIDKDGWNAENELRQYFKREGGGKPIKALWDVGGYSWQYETQIPHETFEIVEDGESYCRGIVFALADVTACPAANGG